jgi:Bacterial membrane protein YfhO
VATPAFDGPLVLPARRTPAREAVAFCAVAAAILAYLFRDALLHGHVLGQADVLFDFLPWQTYKPVGSRIHNRLLGDIPTVFYPFLFHAREIVRGGAFPLWSSATAAGQPFFAAFQTALLSPFTLLHYVLPFPASLTADAAARLLAGGLGMYLFLRALPLSAGAAAFGGIAYLLNPFSIVWLEHPLSAVASCLPWVLLTVDRAARRMDARSVALVAVATALTLLTGHPETAFKVILLGAVYAVYRGLAHGRIAKTTLVLASAMVLGALLASVQLLPFLEYARESRILAVRGGSGPLLTSPLAAFATAFVPDFYGTPLGPRFVLAGTNYCEMQLYPGIVTWIFAAMSFTHPKHRGRAVFFLATGTVAVLIMYGTPMARLVTAIVPPLKVAALSRFGLIGIVGVVISGAIGFDALFGPAEVRVPGSRMRPAIAASIMAALIAVIVFAFLGSQYELLAAARQWPSSLRAVTQSAWLLAATLVVVLVAAATRHRAWVVLPLVLLTADLLAFAGGFHAFIPREQSFQAIAELAVPQADPDTFRVAGWGDTLLPNTALVYGLQDARGYDGIGIRRYASLLDVGFHFNGSTHQLVNVATPHLLDLLNVKYLLTPEDIVLPPDRFQLLRDGATRVYLNRRVMPRAFLVDEVIVLEEEAARRAIRDGIDLSHSAIIGQRLEGAQQPEHAAQSVGTARIRRYEDEAVIITTDADGRRILVLSDVYYPGWVATIDGVNAPIHRVNHSFRGVSLPAGAHIVTFNYRPASFRYGVYLSMCGSALCLWLMVRRRDRSDGGH